MFKTAFFTEHLRWLLKHKEPQSYGILQLFQSVWMGIRYIHRHLVWFLQSAGISKKIFASIRRAVWVSGAANTDLAYLQKKRRVDQKIKELYKNRKVVSTKPTGWFVGLTDPTSLCYIFIPLYLKFETYICSRVNCDYSILDTIYKFPTWQ